MEIEIRNEEPNDINQVRRVVESAFPTDAESQLVDALRANGKAIVSLVVTQGKEVLVHILFSPVSTSPPSAPKGMGLAPVTVDPNYQAQGIGSRPVQVVLQISKELGYDYCVVLGDPKYYRRFGFEKTSSLACKTSME